MPALPRSRHVARALVVLCTAAVLAGACSSSPPAATPPVTATTPAGGTKPSGTVVAGDGAEPVTALERVQREIDREGVTRERALLLYSLAVGPLPGVDLPADDRGEPDETTGAVTAVLGVWDQLDDAQRREVARLQGWAPGGPEASGTAEVVAGDSTGPGGTTPPGSATRRTTPGSTGRGADGSSGGSPSTARPASSAPTATGASLDGASHPLAAPAAVAQAGADVLDSNGATIDAEYLAALGRTQMESIAARTGRTVPGFTVTTYAVRKLGPVHAETTKWRSGLDTLGDVVPYPKGLCNIDVFLPNWPGQTPTINSSIMAHEVFHCFQMTALGSAAATASTGRWLIEGGASWAGLQTVPLARGTFPKYDRFWDRYSMHPEGHLYERDYDAIGFFGHLGDVRGSQESLWPLMLPATVAGQGGANDAAFNQLVAGQEREVLDSWGASYFRFGDKKGWDITGPGGVDGARPSPTQVSVPASGSVVLPQAKPWEIETAEVDSGADIVEITSVSGSVRLLDGPRQRQLTLTEFSPVKLCLIDRCVCPPGTSGFDEQTTPAKAPLNVALTGGRTSAGAYAQGFKLDDFCKEPQRPAPKMPAGGGGGGGGGDNGADDPTLPGGGNGRSKGDPHLTTFDGRSYGFQAVGEYVLTRSTADDLEVQVRQEPFTGRDDVSVNTAVATKVGDDRTTVTLEAGRLVLRVGGDVVDDDFRPLDGGSARRVATERGDGWTIEWGDGTVVDATPIGPYGINVHVVPAADRAGKLEGLLGDDDGNAENDLRARGGDRPVDQFSRDELYGDFGPSWSVDDGSSLFDYPDGRDSASYDDPSFPAKVIDPKDLPGRADAEARCRDAGVTDPRLLEECAVDLALTGKSAFLDGYATISRTVAAEGGDTTGSATAIEGEVTEASQQPRHRIDATEGDVLFVDPDGCEDSGMPTRLDGPDGAEVLTRPGCLLGRIVIPATGTYTLTLNIFGEKTGRYRIPVTPVRHDRTADVRFGDELTGTIEVAGAQDRYRLEAAAGDVLSLSPPDCEAGSLVVGVTAPDGSSVAVGGACTQDAVTLPEAGTYTLVVNPNADGTGTYRIPLRRR